MLKLVFTKANKFKEFTGMLTKISDQVPITMSENGLSVRFLSEDKTTLVTIDMYPETFEIIEVDKEITFTVNTREFNKIAKRATRNDALELIVDEENSMLYMTFIDKKTEVRRTFQLSITFQEKPAAVELKIDLPIQAEMLATDFKDILSDAKLIGEEIEIAFEGDKMIIKTEEAGRDYEAILENGQPVQIIKSETEKAVARYSIDLLQAAIKIASASTSVSISFGSNMPLRLNFEAPDIGNVVYWVAPRE